MTDKKDTNPVMTPEWFEALVSQPAQPAEIQCDNPPERADHTPLTGPQGEPIPTVESTAPSPSPVDPGLLEGIKNCLEDAISALDEAKREVDSAKLEVEGALCNLSHIMEDLGL